MYRNKFISPEISFNFATPSNDREYIYPNLGSSINIGKNKSPINEQFRFKSSNISQSIDLKSQLNNL